MKLEVGMFYRYKGQIGKYKKITELDEFPSFTNNYLRENEIILLNNAKFSYNIIDILEEGDYVNGYEVTSKDQFLGFGNHDWYMTNDEIKSIVTKEQMEQMAYKVEE